MPRDSDKNNDSRGRRDRPGAARAALARQGPVARAARARRGGRRRNSPSAGLPARATATASGVPMPGSPTARNRLARSLIRARESPTPASATAMIVRRAGTLATRRARAAGSAVCAAIVRHAVSDGEKRSFKPREDRWWRREAPVHAARRPSEFQSRRPSAAPRSRRCARPAGRSSDRKFGDKKPYTPREGGGEKRPYTPRGEGFRKDGDRPRGDRPFQRPAVARWRSSPWRSA